MEKQNGNQAHAPRNEPVFEDKPIEESSWGGLVSLLRQVNRLKAELLVSLYGETRVAYRTYLERRDQAIERYNRQQQEDTAYNQHLDAEIVPLLQELGELSRRQFEEMDALRREGEAAYLRALIEAGRYGLNLRGDPLFGFEQDNPTHAPTQSSSTESQTPSSPPPPNSLEPQPVRGNLLTRWFANRAAQSDGSQPSGTLNPSVDRDALRQEIRQVLCEELGTDPKVRQPAQAGTSDPLPPLSESEIVAKDHLPMVNPPILPLWLWWILVVFTGGFVGLLSLIAFGVNLRDWQAPLLWLAIGAGVATSLLFVSALWGAAAVVGELYHLFSWEENKSAKASKLMGGLWLLFLVWMFGMLIFLALTAWAASAVSPVRGVVLTFVGLMVLSMASVAMINGFLYGRRKWTEHRIAAQRLAAERERSRPPRREPEIPNTAAVEMPPVHANAVPTPLTERTHSASLQGNEPVNPAGADVPIASGNGGLTETAYAKASPNPQAVVESDARLGSRTVPDDVLARIAEARARRQIYTDRQNFFEQRKQELQAQINRLEQQKRPIYTEVTPEDATTLHQLSGVWARRYTYFLEALAEALKECKDGETLAEEVRRHKQEIIRTYLP